jgi:hypothetical protein
MKKGGVFGVISGELVIAGIAVEVTIRKNKVNQVFR